MADAPANRLIDETSPYLLQHAHNPVDWHPWGEEALARAKREDRPILLSIGYSACHWCHVMERESFENPDIAAQMNENFVCVKVDREERPDLDDVYMAATLTLNQGQGGWPMTVFLTPELEPFFAGTYFPPEDRFGRPGFPMVLNALAKAWREEREALAGQAKSLTERLRAQARPAPDARLGEAEIDRAVEQLYGELDRTHGGFRGAPKFPPHQALLLLMRAWRRTGDERAWQMVTLSLDQMAAGGIYDQVGGGFCRYATDEAWLVPHFEKMLYDNAQLARAYLEGYALTGYARYERVGRQTLDYILREMTDDAGGFYSATDADSEGVEGKFFVWTPEQIEEAIGDRDRAENFCLYYDITEAGNWEGKSIPNVPRPLPQVAERLNRKAEDLAAEIEQSRAKVFEARAERVHPGLDDKILTAWNALMIGAMVDGYRILGDERYLRAAEDAARFLREDLVDDSGRLLRTYRAGKAHLQAYLEDHAFLADALVDLFEVTGERAHLDWASELGERILGDFVDEQSGAFYSVAADHETLIVRRLEGHDGAIPSANSVAARALLRLGRLLEREQWVDAARRAVQAFGRPVATAPQAFASNLAVVDGLLEPPLELVVAGEPSDAACAALRQEVGRRYIPNRLLVMGPPEALEASAERVPLLAGKGLVQGRPALYVCRDYACQSPITNPESVGPALTGEAEASHGRRRDSLAEPMPGSASPEGTKRYAERFEGQVRRKLGELDVSLLGFGGYRVDEESPEHREALRDALRRGVNLIDTSTNYTGGSSERLVGDVIGRLVREGDLQRDELVVVSKAGYIQGENLEIAQRRKSRGQGYPEVVEHGDQLWHCVHPEFLADQLGRSLARLQLASLDVLLLHNPEYFLSDAYQREGKMSEPTRDTFYDRLRRAFVYLEQQVQAGRIGRYGVSSNTVGADPDEPDATSLSRMLEAAREAAKEAGVERHHFEVLQLPLNLLETGPALTRNTGDGQTALEVARAEGVAVLVNRPLNAITERGLVRLASFEVPDEAPALHEQLAKVREHEDQLRQQLATRLRTNVGELNTASLFRWGEELAGLQDQIDGLPTWQQIEHGRIRPQLGQTLRLLDRGLPQQLAQRWSEVREAYLESLAGLLDAFYAHAAAQSQKRARAVADAIAPKMGDRARAPLSQQALWTAASLAGVTTVLCGMRRPEYVEDALEVMTWAPHGQPVAVLEAAASSGWV